MADGSPVAPAAPVAPTTTTPATEAHPDLAAARAAQADAQAKLATAEKKARVLAAEQRKFADDKKGIGAKLSEYDKMKKAQANAKLNKSAFLRETFGDDWYEQVINERINGGAPTADTIALTVQQLEEKVEAKFAAREEESKRQMQAQSDAQLARDMENVHADARDFYKGASKEYPIFAKLGGEAQVAKRIVQIMSDEVWKNSQKDENGRVTRPGRAPSFKEAADMLEEELLGFAESAAEAEKYRSRLTAKMAPVKTAPVVSGGPQLRRTESLVERRTLSNDLTASTASARKPALTDEERRERSIAAFNTVRSRNPQ